MNDAWMNMLRQMMQNTGAGGQDEQFETREMPPELPPPWDMLLSLRPMLPLRERRIIDLLMKLQEIKLLLAEIRS